MAERIQRQRTRGYRLPPGAIYVGRPTRWGNPWVLGSPEIGTRPDGTAWSIDDVLRWYRWMVTTILQRDPDWLEPLRGHDLACWCPLTAGGNPWPCHADVLLQLLGEQP